jgi:hypothetical protein
MVEFSRCRQQCCTTPSLVQIAADEMTKVLNDVKCTSVAEVEVQWCSALDARDQ